MDETWRPVVGYEGLYEVSSKGAVRSVERVVVRSNGRKHRVASKVRSLATMPKGHLRVTLIRDGQPRTHTVHALVLSAFSGPRPEGAVARHLNGVPSDNRIVNLQWGTASENQLDAVAHGAHYLSSKTHCVRGHRLEAPNLLGSRGRRVCRACRREHDSSRHDGRPFDPKRADARYDDILKGKVRHKSESRF